MISEEHREHLREELAHRLVNPVKLVVFTQKF